MTTGHSQQATHASRRSHAYLIVIIVMTAIVSPASAAGCPERCECRQQAAGGTVVDCRGRGLTAIVSEFPGEAVELDFGDNPITTINRNSFPSASKVRRLRMDGCRLERLERMSFRNLQLLEVLDLSGNRIRSLDDGAFQGLQHLRQLNLNRNDIQSPPGYLFRGLNLDELRLGGNGLREISEELFGAAKIRSLNLDQNDLAGVDREFLRPLESSLRTLSVSNNSRPLEVARDAFSGVNFTTLTISSSQLGDASFLSHTVATQLDLSGNQLGSIIMAPIGSSLLGSSCRELRLSDIGLESLDVSFLSNLPRLTYLDLSANQLVTLKPEMFRYTPDLTTLDLSRNRFVRLPEGFGYQLYSLETLNLSRSLIVTPNWDNFRAMPRLRVLDLSGNRLQVIPENASSVLESIAALNLSGNPWHCNCEMRWFRHWLAEETRQVGSLRCASPTSDFLLNRDPANFVCTSPQISLITRSQNVREGTNVLLNCAAQSDPAPAIVWRAPFGDVLSITPPEDRTRMKTIADWAINLIRPYQSGWYTCNSTNILGSNITYTYLHVIGAENVAMDLTNLTYPMVPSKPSVVMEHTVGNTRLNPDRSTMAVNEPTSAGDSSIKETTPLAVPTTRGIQEIWTVLQRTTKRLAVAGASTSDLGTISDWDEVDGYITPESTSVGFDRGVGSASSSSLDSGGISSERATGKSGDTAAETGQAPPLSKQAMVVIIVVVLVVVMLALVFGVLGVIVYRRKCHRKYPVNPRDGPASRHDASEKTKLQMSNLDDSGYSSTVTDPLNPPPRGRVQ